MRTAPAPDRRGRRQPAAWPRRPPAARRPKTRTETAIVVRHWSCRDQVAADTAGQLAARRNANDFRRLGALARLSADRRPLRASRPVFFRPVRDPNRIRQVRPSLRQHCFRSPRSCHESRTRRPASHKPGSGPLSGRLVGIEQSVWPVQAGGWADGADGDVADKRTYLLACFGVLVRAVNVVRYNAEKTDVRIVVHISPAWGVAHHGASDQA